MPIQVDDEPRLLEIDGVQRPIGKDVLIGIVLDASSSMMGTAAQTRSGINEYITGLRNDKETDYRLTMVQFSSTSRIQYTDKPLTEVEPLTESNYAPAGMTALLDAVGDAVETIDNIRKGRPVVVIIMTDGEENSSRRFNREQVKALLDAKQEDGWTVTFMGANMDSWANAAAIGVAYAGNTVNYFAGQEQANWRGLMSRTTMYAGAIRGAGLVASASNFTENLMKAADDVGIKLDLSKVKARGKKDPK